MAKRILIVDDDPDFRDATETILAGAGYEVDHAATRSDAEQRLDRQVPDLILLDVMMETDTEGFHLAYKLRDDERFRDIPIVILTCIEEKTGETIEPEKSGDYLPVDAYLRKPVSAADLKAKLAELLQ